ncbi:MAG: PDZ domain-containing protein [Acidobacteriota bacterium]
MSPIPRWQVAIGCGLGLAAAIVTSAQSGLDESALDRAFGAYWLAADPEEAAQASEQILATGADFDTVRDRLMRGRSYATDVPTGRLLLERSNRDGLEHPYLVLVPEDYDPGRRYPARVYLHGGANRARRKEANWWRNPQRLADPEQIAVFPYAWKESLWWQGSQAENLGGILDGLKRTYNVDENRVYLFGVSDGGTGVYFFAFRTTTPWAGFLPFIGQPAVLNSPNVDADGQMYVANLLNKPFFVVNGGLDPLYPPASVVPYLTLFEDVGVRVRFHLEPDSGHNTRWWPEEAAAIDSFIDSNPRNPLPDRIWWETERTDRYNRAHWLLIDELGSVKGERAFPERNSVSLTPKPGLGLGVDKGGDQGVRLTRVQSGSTAEVAGLQKGDLIVEVDGLATPTVQQLRQALRQFSYGSSVPLTILRQGSRRSILIQLPPRPEPVRRVAFPHPFPSGRVELRARGNLIEVQTRGVRRYSLLLSPRQFDFSQPIKVITNGHESFNRRVVADVGTLLRWAARDNDRTMLFGAELEIEVANAG